MGDQLRLRAPDHSGAESAAQIAELEGFAARVVCRKAGTRQSMAAKLAGRTRAAGADLPVRADCVLDRVSLRMDRETGSQPAMEDVAAFRGAAEGKPGARFAIVPGIAPAARKARFPAKRISDAV